MPMTRDALPSRRDTLQAASTPASAADRARRRDGPQAQSPRQQQQAARLAALRLTGPQAGTGDAAQGPAVQLRRDPSAVEMQLHLEHCHNDDLSDDPPPRTADDVRKNWQTSHAAGLRVMQRGLDWFTASARALPRLSTQETHENLAAKGYKTFLSTDADQGSVELRTHRGAAVDELDPGEVETFELGDDQDYFYSNEYRGATGEFHASVNYGNADAMTAGEEGLPETARNAEIIWHQYQLARAALLKTQPTVAPQTLKNITRNEISNTRTLDTIFMCDGGAQAQAGGTVRLDDPNEDAIALLGTPNGNSAAYVLIQHGHEFGGQDIESISYGKDWLDIKYITA